MTDGDLMMKAIGLLILTSQAVTAWALLTGRAQRREIAPQPFDIRTTHDCVPRPEFEKHRDEIWEVVNGIRRGISRTSEDISAIRALREDNGKRLEKVEERLSDVSDTLHEQAGSLHEIAKRINA